MTRGGSARRAARAASCAVAVLAVAAPALGGPLPPARGVVFVDVDRDGARDDGEPGAARVVVQRGAVLAFTDDDGRYALPAAAADDGPVFVTRPSGFDCARWYREDGGDFALVARDAARASGAFVHLSDAHVTDRASDLARLAVPAPIAAMPRWLAGQAMLLLLRGQHGAGVTSGAIADALVRAEYGDGARRSASAATTVGSWVHRLAALGDGASGDAEGDGAPPGIDPVRDFRASLREIARLAPDFVVSTGDLVLESNEVDGETAGRWLDFYLRETRATGLAFHETIGNNEIVGIGLDPVDPAAPGFGKAAFRARFGPTAYAFDRGELHFVALDTHRARSASGDDWSFTAMEPRVRAWLSADLAAHAGSAIVVLNHEPFASDPSWPLALRLAPTVEDADWIGRAGVAYTLTGHLHASGSSVDAHEHGSVRATQHVSTGALSGARWVFPADAAPRGYRLVQMRGRELYSAWKRTGEPLVAFVSPPDRAAFATRPPGADPAAIVVVAADRAGPFAAVELWRGEERVALEAWSPYFFAARDPATGATGAAEATRGGDGSGAGLRVVARRANGEVVARELAPAR